MAEFKPVLLPFVRMLFSHWRPVAAGTFMGLLTLVATVGLLALSGWFLSAAAHAGMVAATALSFNYFFPSIGVRIFAISRTLGRYADRILSHDATFRLLESLRVWFYRRLEPLAPARLMQYRSGDILSRIVSDIDALDNLYLRVLSPSVVAALMTLLVVAFLRRYDAVLAALALGGLLGAGLAGPVAAGLLGAATGRRLVRLNTALRTEIVEGIQGLAELLVFGRHEQWLAELESENRALLQAQRRMSHIAGISFAWITLIAGLTTTAALFRGAQLVNAGRLDGAALAMVALAVLASFDAVMALPAAYQYFGRTRAAARRLLEIVEAPSPVQFPDQSVARLRHYGVEFRDVYFQYRSEGPPALAEIRFAVESGQQVAVLGQTGCGKTTLAHLLVRFWNPLQGQILLGGADIRKLSESDLRRTVTLISQQAHLFNASIAENLRIARDGADEAALWDALAAVELADFVRALPHGLDTWIGEGGKMVSGGQARRLTVARALLRDAPVWILDEPTEGLDRGTERKMMATLRRLTAGRTVLLITHRLEDVERTDRILVLANGRLVEEGTPAALRQAGGHYAKMRARSLSIS